MMKRLLRSVLGNKIVDYEELLTLICEAESVMNQRPLTHNEEAGGRVLPLFPAQFIQDNPTVYLSEADLVEEKLLRQRSKQVQMLRQELEQGFSVKRRPSVLLPAVTAKAARDSRSLPKDDLLLPWPHQLSVSINS
ncbi:hypothetical protein ILUMI_26381 [Ignelater luminosus]|uniref:Uncharacterized protein n=1 Tax=Ignelater luminosus TaxID=2038154 RepID=A0A8K0C4E9_IGNLU|nr:hypothetical protein ILUMI_26381 [Ignelater luminosus]